MNYNQDTDRWFEDMLSNLANQKMTLEDAKRAIRERLLQSFKNGLKAKPRAPKPVGIPQSSQPEA